MENREKKENLMTLSEAWKLFQSLKHTFSISNKKQIVELFQNEYGIIFFDLKDVMDGKEVELKAVMDKSEYDKIAQKYKDAMSDPSFLNKFNDELKENALVMTQQEWFWRPIEEGGLMPFLYEILSAVEARRNQTKNESQMQVEPVQEKKSTE